MAATFTQLAQIAQNQDFQLRVKLGILSTALAVYSEPTTTTGHGTRAQFATKVLASTGYDLFAVSLAVLTAPGNIATNANQSIVPDFGIADTDITSQLSAMWNAMAGV